MHKSKSIYLPDSLKKIGSAAFFNCNSLSTVNMPEGIESVGGNVFDGTEVFENSVADERFHKGNCKCCIYK